MATRDRVSRQPQTAAPTRTSTDAAGYAPEGQSAHLPPLEYRDMPKAPPFRKIIGPSVVLVGVGISSGEFIIWPYITSQVGLIFLWAAFAGIFMQFILNMEIERYTLATGETAIVGFARSWKPWGMLFILGAVIPNFWPGWATSSATLTTFAVGGGDPTTIAIIFLVVMGLTLTLSPVVYKTMEKVEFLKVGVVLVFLAVVLVVGINGDTYSDLPKTVTDAGWASGLDVAVVLGALAFAGAGGVNNLCQSNWIRDKGFGMGKHIPHVVSPITGEDQAKPSTGYMMRPDEANVSRFNDWWRLANKEQFFFFFLCGLAAIIVFSLLAYSTVFGQDLGESLDFVEGEGNILKDEIGSWFGTLFWAIGAASLFAGSLGILDYVARVSADVIKTLYARESQRITESRIYFLFVWGEIALGTIVLLSGFDQPLALLIVASSLNGVVMFFYSVLLIRLNRKGLPMPIRVRGIRLYLLYVISAVFGVLSVALLLSQI
jgi:hypothetical protein